jgi:hypothetical protein
MRIKRFRQFNESLLLEGGNVFFGTRKILKSSVEPTVDDIADRLFAKVGLALGKNAIRIGSAGKADVSGDIDFGVEGMDLKELRSKICSEIPSVKTNMLDGLEVLSVKWPIEGTHSMVQVDFVPVYSRKWSEFVYKYPDGSKYKSAHRNWLIMSILSSIRSNVEYDPETKEPVEYDGYIMNLNKGLFSMRKDYHGKTKILKHGVLTDEKLITSDPDEFVKFVFGAEYKPEDVGTFESAVRIVEKPDFKWHDNLEDIVENLEKFLDRAGLAIPTELERL